MFQKKLLVLALLACALVSNSAHAMVTFSLAGAGNYGLVNDDNGVKGKFGYGGGALVQAGLGNRAGFEVGGIYLHKNYDLRALGVTVGSASANSVFIPGNFVFGLSPGFDFLVGGFYEPGVGSSSGSHDEGVQGGVRFGHMSGVFLDLRYTYGFEKNAFGDKESNILGLLGIAFGGSTH